MSKKINDCYEYKEAPIRQAMAYASFGWLIGKRSKHYSRKYNCDVVTLRRDFLIGANPTIRECEKEYLRLEKGRIPAKYKSHAFLKAIGKIFVILITIALLLFGLAQTAVGVYDGLKKETKVRALYNAAVDSEAIADKEVVSADKISQNYVEFVKKNPTLDSFSELCDLTSGSSSKDELLQSYKNWLFKFGEADFAHEESFAAVDPTVDVGKDDYVASTDQIDSLLDTLRETLAFLNFDYLFNGMPLWINTASVSGAAAIVVFIIMVVIEAAAGKAKKKNNRRRCAELMIECSKNAASALFDMKAEHRELRTKKDDQIYNLQTMFTKVMDSRDDEE